MQLTRINNDKQTGNCPAKIRKLFILILNKIISGQETLISSRSGFPKIT